MNRIILLSAAFLLILTVLVGCSGHENPVAPNQNPGLTNEAQIEPASPANSCLWGYYDVYWDQDTQEITAVPNRDILFTLNTVWFLNNNPTGISFHKNKQVLGTGYVDVDIDVTIKHPIKDNHAFDGYDVRGVLIGNGSGTLQYNTDLKYARMGTDQYLMDDPDDLDGGGPDGYTRWFNKVEFPSPTIYGYIPGKFASSGLVATGTINAYRYFADGLGANDDAWDFLNATTDNGVFSSGSSNTRNYYIRFPIPTPGAKFGYAVLANWISPVIHPANAEEALACDVTVTDDIYYVDASNKGGDLILDISLFAWGDQPNGIFVESTVLNSVHELTPSEMIPTGGSYNSSTYHAEIPADHITGTANQEFWVTAQRDDVDYSNPKNVLNSAWNDPLAAFFRSPLYVSDTPYNLPPIIESGVDGPSNVAPDDVSDYTVDASDPDLDPLDYFWTVTDLSDMSIVFSGIGDGSGGFQVDWTVDVGAEVGDNFRIDCAVNDGVNPDVYATPLTVTCTGGNLPPLILSGVDGNADFSPTSIEDYSVSAMDPDGDTLTYSWTVMDLSDLSIVFSGPGDGDGGFQVDWANDVGATDGDSYLIRCQVTDSINPAVEAMPLTVTCVSGNLPPEIISGVDGLFWFEPDWISDYSVTADDPEMDPLTYTWTVTEEGSGDVVLTGPGDGAGNFQVDWANDVGPTLDEHYDIDCAVSDGINPDVPATTLVALCKINQPPNIISGVDGEAAPEPTAVEDYTVFATDPDDDPVTYTWVMTDDIGGTVTTTMGDLMPVWTIDWNELGVSDGEIYHISCDVNDPFNPPVSATPLTVTITESGAIILYEYDGTVDDGGIVCFGGDYAGWEYCTDSYSWDEGYCDNYPAAIMTLAMTPVIDFPAPGTFTNIHIEIWHWGDMYNDEGVYGTLGALEDAGGGTWNWYPNWDTEELVYVEGFDFNDGDWADWSLIFGSESDPEWSHFTCNSYAGYSYAIGFQFEEYGAGNPLSQDGWDIRKLVIWVEP